MLNRLTSPRRNLCRTVFAALLTLGVMAAGMGLQTPAWADQAAADIDPAKLKKLKKDIRKLQRWLDEAKGQQYELQRELRRNERSINDLSRQISDLQQDLNETQQKLHALQARRDSIEDQLRAQKSVLHRQIQAAYQTGRQEYLKILLNLENPAKLSRMLTYYDYFSSARAQRIDEYNALLLELRATREGIVLENQKLLARQAELAERKSGLAKVRSERKRTLAKLTRSIDSKGSELKRLEEDQERLQALLREVERAIAELALPSKDAAPFGKLKGRLDWPVKGNILAHFGSTHTGGKLRWNGVIIGANEGKEVQAVHYGRIVFADWLRGFGLLMIIDHGDGYLSLYGHNQTLLKDTGDWVRAGETIATVGNSGGQNKTGLYFEIRHQGKPSNPLRWFRKRA